MIIGGTEYLTRKNDNGTYTFYNADSEYRSFLGVNFVKIGDKIYDLYFDGSQKLDKLVERHSESERVTATKIDLQGVNPVTGGVLVTEYSYLKVGNIYTFTDGVHSASSSVVAGGKQQVTINNVLYDLQISGSGEVKLIAPFDTSVRKEGYVLKLLGATWDVVPVGNLYTFKSGTESATSNADMTVEIRGTVFQIQVDKDTGVVTLVEATKASQHRFDQVIEVKGKTYGVIDHGNMKFGFVLGGQPEVKSYDTEPSVELDGILYDIAQDPFTGFVSLIERHLDRPAERKSLAAPRSAY